jgi:hypothetical protein
MHSADASVLTLVCVCCEAPGLEIHRLELIRRRNDSEDKNRLFHSRQLHDSHRAGHELSQVSTRSAQHGAGSTCVHTLICVTSDVNHLEWSRLVLKVVLDTVGLCVACVCVFVCVHREGARHGLKGCEREQLAVDSCNTEGCVFRA